MFILSGVKDLSERVCTGTSRIFVDSGELKATQFIHTVIISHLTPNQYYIYRLELCLIFIVSQCCGV